MPAINHGRQYRPLRGGIVIFNPLAVKPGTLGAIVTSRGQDRWIVSCYHVLGRQDLGPCADGEPIYQPLDDAHTLVARISTARVNRQLDCAAARIEQGIDTVPEILGLPAITGVSEPVAGMRVLKSGYATGITEGVIAAVNGDDVLVEANPAFTDQYELTAGGDSGAVWVAADTGKLAAMHTQGGANQGRLSKGVRFSAVLTALDLRLM